MPPTERLRKPILIAVLLITAAVYLPALNYGFVADDPEQIVRMQSRFTWHNVPGYFTTDVWSYIRVMKGNYYRPIFLTWLMLNYRLFGLETALWHAAAIALHLAAVALLYFLALQLTKSVTVAGIAALLFGVHPVHVEAVAWVSGATEPLFAVFALGMLLCYLRSRDGGAAKTPWQIASVALFALCIFSKETAIVLPILVGACELSFAQELFAQEKELRKRLMPAFTTILPFVAVSLFYLAARHHALGGFAPQLRNWTPRMLVGTLPAALWFYVHQTLLPWRYSIFYPIGPVLHFDFAGFWAPLLTVVAVAGVLLWISLRSRLAAFCSLLLILPTLPVLNLRAFDFDDFLHDRYMYLPSAGLCILAALGIDSVFSHLPLWRGLAVAAPAAFLCAVNLNASSFWADEVSLFSHAYERAPDNHHVHVNLGYALVKAERFADAAPLLKRALAADPENYTLTVGLGECYFALGDLDEAAGYFRNAILFHPSGSAAYVHLAWVETRQNQLAQAEAHMRQALQLRESLTEDTRTYHYLLGNILEQEGDTKGALAEYEADLREDPSSENAAQRLRLLRRQ